MTPPPNASVLVTATKIEPADAAAPPILVVDIAVNCPHCGQYQVRFLGHHLRSIRDALVQVIDRFPECAGDEGSSRVVRDEQWQGITPRNPLDN